MAEDYYSFEDVMNELAIDEDELKRMVSEGELRAFRSENKMKFKADDVENLKKGRVSEPTVILPSTPTPPQGVPSVDETALELDLESELGELKAAEEKPTEELTPGEPGTTSGPEEPLVFDDTGSAPAMPDASTKAPDETFAEEEEVEIAPDTEPLKFADEPEIATEEVTVEAPVAGAEVLEGVAAAPSPSRRSAGTRQAPGQLPGYVEEQIEKRRAHWVWSLIMTVTMIGTVAYILLMFDVLRVSTGKIETPSKMTDGIVIWTLEQFWQDPEYLAFHMDEMPLPPGAVVEEEVEPITPPFDAPKEYHRAYEWMSYKEPRFVVHIDELEEISNRVWNPVEDELPPEEGDEFMEEEPPAE